MGLFDFLKKKKKKKEDAAPGKEKTMLTIGSAYSFQEIKPSLSGESRPGSVSPRAYKAMNVGSRI